MEIGSSLAILALFAGKNSFRLFRVLSRARFFVNEGIKLKDPSSTISEGYTYSGGMLPFASK